MRLTEEGHAKKKNSDGFPTSTSHVVKLSAMLCIVIFIMLLYDNCCSFTGALFGSLRRQSIHNKQLSQKQIEDVHDISRDHKILYLCMYQICLCNLCLFL